MSAKKTNAFKPDWNASQGSSEIKKMTPSEQPFSKLNFLLIGGCGLLIIIGFLLMLGDGSSAENGFNPEIFSTRRIVTGPLLAFLGFLLMAFAIFVNPDKQVKKKAGKTHEGNNSDKNINPEDNGMA